MPRPPGANRCRNCAAAHGTQPGLRMKHNPAPAAAVCRHREQHMSTTPARSLGLIGLGVMGENLALNFERNGFSVCGFDLDAARRQQFTQRTQGLQAGCADSLAALVGCLQTPRRILLMVPAGAAVDAVLSELRPLLAAGDVLIDGGTLSATAFPSAGSTSTPASASNLHSARKACRPAAPTAWPPWWLACRHHAASC